MERKDRFSPDIEPQIELIGEFINSSLWDELRSFIEGTYEVQPSIEYSKCSLETGWNVKYKKGSRSICTVYPQENSFTCLVTIGRKEADEAELLLPSLSKYVQEVYSNAGSLNGARWLMINVTDDNILEDVKRLILVRVKPKMK
ncbi:MAG: DUF3788 domain-containing protein [Candidatus Metalachnospira sp.]|nr:DUF3788 domain-containing protein [Candidatus Metalachnospira sp.]